MPCTWTAPASTAASELATARSQSLCVWMPSGTSTAAAASLVSAATSSGMLPPLVSHITTIIAPPSTAAWIVLRAYSGFAFQPSKKCSAS